MIERRNGNSLPTQEQISKAYSRFEILLDRHHIPQEEQDERWVKVYEQIESNPMKIIGEIQDDWETTFPTNENSEVDPRSPTTSEHKVSNGKNVSRLGPKIALNKWRRERRIEYYENYKAGGPKKARKKARKR